MNGHEPERISISLDTLRKELADLKLDLVDRIAEALEKKADTKVVEQHDSRINALELSRAGREHLPTEVADLKTDVEKLKGKVADWEGESKYRKYLVPAVAAVIGAAWWVPYALQHVGGH